MVSIPVSQGLPGLDLIDHRMRHCSKLGDSNKKNKKIFQMYFKCALKYKLFKRLGAVVISYMVGCIISAKLFVRRKQEQCIMYAISMKAFVGL